MRGKYIIITLLVVLLGITVYEMMQYESSLRQRQTVKLYLEDESKPLLQKLNNEELRNAALNADYYFTANGDYFQTPAIKYPESGKQLYWENIFLKGVNLGVAMPGKFPAEFSLSFSEYLDWFILIGEMNANTIRTYTILPPEFYEALAFYNLHYHDKPLYLIQGVWADIPEDDNYFNLKYSREFRKEIIDMVDVVHGNAVLKPTPGKASGVYTANVSKYIAAFLLGREWEPSAVFKTNRENNTTHYNGDFIHMNNGNAMESWLAEMIDFTVLYETQTYRTQHPVSFVNWLPLDPMFHNTEIIENEKVREYDNDLESIDFEKFHATELFYPGIYAAYHAYPYYPDFVYLQQSYVKTLNSENNPDPYLGYLLDLKNRARGMPLLIAEYGVPSSRGVSHVSPFGFDQGGHSEAEQSDLAVKLTKDIVEANCAGAIYFEWIDEWFKHNWLVMDFEQPFENRTLWHNMENPEQNFGIYAMESRAKTIDGSISDWEEINLNNSDISVHAAADAGYFYLVALLPGIDLDSKNIFVAIDTYDDEKGDHKLPFTNHEFENGFEFLLQLNSKDSGWILVDEPYSVFTDIYNDYIPVYASQKNSNGNFIHQLMLTNREREDLLDIKTERVIVDRSPLVFGNSSLPATSNADWYLNNDTLEVRLDWHLLNVSDPSNSFVLDDQPGTAEIEFTKTDGFNLFIFITDKSKNLLKQYPQDDPYFFTWEEWKIPEYTKRLKPVYSAFEEYFKELEFETDQAGPDKSEDIEFELADFYNNKTGAVSLSFDNAGYSQYEYALPVLSKYGLNASFGIIPELVDDNPGLYELEDNSKLKRLGAQQVRELAVNNEIAYQSLGGNYPDRKDILSLGNMGNTYISTLHPDSETGSDPVNNNFLFVRKTSNGNVLKTSFDDVGYSVVNFKPTMLQLDSILNAGRGKWTIFVYHHFFGESTDVPTKMDEKLMNRLFTKQSGFEKQIRLMRNNNYWIAPERDVFKYLKESEESVIQFARYQNVIFMKIVNRLDRNVFDHPLTVNFKTSATTIRIKGSEMDGIFTNRTGEISFNASPNKEITIEILDE